MVEMESPYSLFEQKMFKQITCENASFGLMLIILCGLQLSFFYKKLNI
jgi:hypothetical protein